MLLAQSHAYRLAYVEAHPEKLFSWRSDRGLELLDAFKKLRVNQGWILPSRLSFSQSL